MDAARRRWLLAGSALALGLAAACKRDEGAAPELTVFAAASLRDVLGDAAAAWAPAGGGPRVVFDFAGSNELVRQIVASRRADVFVSASDEWMDSLEQKGLLAAASRRVVARNRLVVVASRASAYALDDPKKLADLPFRVLSLGDPRVVPAGQYARAWLEGLGGGVWDRVRSRVAPAPDVRAALGLVVRDVDAIGVVYATDVTEGSGVRVLYRVPTEAAPPIRYPAAALASRPRERQARDFVEFLAGPRAAAVFQEHGFLPAAE